MRIEDQLAEMVTLYHNQCERMDELAKDLRQAWGLVGSQQERIQQLEQLVRDYAKWVAPMETTVKSGESIPESWWEAKRALQERARAFLSD